MKKLTHILLFFIVINKTGAQNWAPVNCFNSQGFVERIFLDSLHNKLIVSSRGFVKNCNKSFRYIGSFDGENFDNMNKGLQTHDTIFAWTSLASNAVSYKNKTIIGGNFQSVGIPFKYSPILATWDDNKWDTLHPSPFKNVLNTNSQYINGFFVDNNLLYIYGAFNSMGGNTCKNLVIFDGLSYTPLNLPVNYNYNVNQIIKFKGELYITGNYFNFPNNNFDKLIKYKDGVFRNVGNGIPASLGGPWDMIVYKDTLFIGGEFKKSDGNAGNYIVKWDGSNFYDGGFGEFYDWGGIRKLLIYKDRLYAFGRFKYAANQKAYGAAYYENGKWVANQDSLDNVILDAEIYKNEIYISGGFSSINADTSLKYFVKLKCPDFDGCKKNNSVENFNIPFPNPFSNQLTINLPNETQTQITIVNSLGQIISKQILFTKSTINTSTWPTGIYFIYINNNYINKTFKVVKE